MSGYHSTDDFLSFIPEDVQYAFDQYVSDHDSGPKRMVAYIIAKFLVDEGEIDWTPEEAEVKLHYLRNL